MTPPSPLPAPGLRARSGHYIPHALAPLCCETGVEGYRFRLVRDFPVALMKGFRGTHYYTHRGVIRAVLEDEVLTIRAGYAWDGCSPARRVLGRWIGTPTPASTRAASLVHDCLYQFMHLPCAPWDRTVADDVFYELMCAEGFLFRGTWHGAVALFGGLFRRLSGRDPHCSCTRHHVVHPHPSTTTTRFPSHNHSPS